MADVQDRHWRLELHLDADGTTIQAVCSPVDTAGPALHREAFQRAWLSEGFGDCVIDETAVAELLRQWPGATAAFTLTVGERRDAAVTVCVSDDKMRATLSVSAAGGGRKVDHESIHAALTEAGITHGIDTAIIDTCVRQGQAQAVTVASGTPPAAGKDAEFFSLIAEIRDRHPKIDEHGMVDYRDLGNVTTVKAGEPLMRRQPATPGVPGKNVLGEEVPAVPGKDTPFAPRLSGAELDATDPDLLRAAISGQPVLADNAVIVEPTLAIASVDLSSGNLEFDGTVNVAGNVATGMKIKASGDVNVAGLVEAAHIEAGGDITVKGGIIGHDDAASDTQAGQGRAELTSGGSVRAKFIEHAAVRAGHAIVVQDAVRQSDLRATNQVIVGAEGAKRGGIIGGTTQASSLVQTPVIGSPSGVVTRVEVGVNPWLHQQLDDIRSRLQQLEKEAEDVEKLLAYGTSHPERIRKELMTKAWNTAETLEQGKLALAAESEALQAQMGLAVGARIVVGQRVFGGALIRVGHKTREITDELGNGVFCLVDDEVDYTI